MGQHSPPSPPPPPQNRCLTQSYRSTSTVSAVTSHNYTHDHNEAHLSRRLLVPWFPPAQAAHTPARASRSARRRYTRSRLPMPSHAINYNGVNNFVLISPIRFDTFLYEYEYKQCCSTFRMISIRSNNICSCTYHIPK